MTIVTKVTTSSKKTKTIMEAKLTIVTYVTKWTK